VHCVWQKCYNLYYLPLSQDSRSIYHHLCFHFLLYYPLYIPEHSLAFVCKFSCPYSSSQVSPILNPHQKNNRGRQSSLYHFFFYPFPSSWLVLAISTAAAKAFSLPIAYSYSSWQWQLILLLPRSNSNSRSLLHRKLCKGMPRNRPPCTANTIFTSSTRTLFSNTQMRWPDT
jgi:hypothetical protein